MKSYFSSLGKYMRVLSMTNDSPVMIGNVGAEVKLSVNFVLLNILICQSDDILNMKQNELYIDRI